MLRDDRIIFVDPFLSSEQRYASLAGAGQLAPPIGLLYLAANCRKHGFEASIIDANALAPGDEAVVERVREEQPKFVGISANTLSISSAACVARKLHELNSEVFTIVGGAHISSCPEETMKRFPHFDAGVIGEGEQTIVELTKAIAGGGDLESVDGIIYRSGEKLVKTRPREYIKTLDDLPMPAWDLLPSYEAYKLSATRYSLAPVGSIITSRGCPGECTFCDRSVFGRGWRGHGVDYVLEMIRENIRTHHIRSLVINDDTFVINRKRLISICEAMIEEKMNLSWSCSARINEMTPEMLSIMKRAGCFQIAYGLESGSSEILKLMKKKVMPDRMKKIIGETRKAGIRSKGYFIVGHPCETLKTIEETIAFALSVPLDDAQFTFLTPFPGTEVYEKAKESGSFDGDWEKMSMWDIAYVPEGLSSEQMSRMRSRAFRKFYFRPRIVCSYGKMALSSLSFSLSLLRDFVSFVKFVVKK
jgi:anaerobic magnesium-protoporphyrin IX monomethyl ester cyclase